MFLKRSIYIATVCVSASCFWGCSSAKSSSASDVLVSMQKDIKKTSSEVATSNVTLPMALNQFPLLKETCTNSFKTPSYKFDGEKLRFKVKKFAYKLPVEGHPDSMLYRHQYAVCFDFYPAEAGDVQEALYVSYLGTIASDVDKLIEAVAAVPGQYQALLSDAGFHTDLTFSENGWPSLDSKVYSDETSAVQYLKMNPLDMKVLNKYGGEKYQKLMAFEFVHAFVTNVDGVIQFHNVTESTYSHVFEAQSL